MHQLWDTMVFDEMVLDSLLWYLSLHHDIGTLDQHSAESNTISSKTIVCQKWCILSKDDEYVKFSIFSEVYDGSVFATSELKTELPELR